jgi:hypothetical protein
MVLIPRGERDASAARLTERERERIGKDQTKKNTAIYVWFRISVPISSSASW